MAHDAVVGFVRRLADPTGYAHATDRELLGWFADGRDDAAFEALVRRHARLVRSAVARVLVNAADIDDATQATFLVLVRRVAREDWRAELGPWLYGVAHRVAVRLRAQGRRRPGPLGEADPTAPVAHPDLSMREACDLLHAELDRLPERYRLPLLLCYLEGQTRDEAAVALGVSVGTVKGRVRRGCNLLRRRLARRGVSLSAGLLAAASPPAAACPSASIATAVSGVARPLVAELAQEVSRTMVTVTNKLIMLGLLVAIGVVVAAGLVAGFSPDPPRALVPVAAPVPKRAPPSMFLAWDAQGIAFLDAAGKEKERPDQPATIGALSPDGRRVAAWEYDKEAGRSKLVIRTRGEKGEPVIIPLVFGEPGRSGGEALWSRDGGRVMNWENAVRKDGTRGYAYRVYDLATKTLTDVNLLEGCAVRDWSVDGKRFLVNIFPSELAVRLAWVNADGTGEPEVISPEKEIGFGGRLSPDGKRVLYLGGPVPREGEHWKVRLYVMDLATKKRTAVDEPGETNGYCWSPDGSRVAYTWQRPLPPEGTRKRETLLITCAADGTDRRTVTSRKYEIPENSSASPTGVVHFFQVHDWR